MKTERDQNLAQAAQGAEEEAGKPQPPQPPQPQAAAQAGPEPARDGMLEAVLRSVKAASGHDFSSYKSNTVLRRIQRRMAVNDVASAEEYLALLQDNALEAQALCQDILIGVTRFFRDPDAFALLRREVIPRIFAGRSPDQPVRIWHPCCASGEEVYSTAMLIREYLDQNASDAPVLIFATDMDERAIVQARSGLYSEEIAQDVGEHRLKTFFTRHNGRYQVSKQLREMVVFAQHSVIKDPPFSRLDLLVCRNFFIYLNQEMQGRLVTLFHQVLKPGGYLFLGSAESVERHCDLFSTVDKRWKIFRRKEGKRRPAPNIPFAATLPKPPVLALNPRQAQVSEGDPGALSERLLVERYAPPCVVVNEKYQVVHVSTRVKRYLEVPLGEPTSDILRMTREELRPALRAAIYKVFAEGQRVEFRGMRLVEDGAEVTVDVLAEPLEAPQAPGKLALVLFEQPAPGSGPEPELLHQRSEPSRDVLVRQLEEQLRVTHEQLQATSGQLESSQQAFLSASEELLSANEELQATNEELQATNEELETSKEELQALNEELCTVNGELQLKVEALNQAGSDMDNLLSTSGMASLFLDRELNIKGFTPAVATLFNLIRSDLGRPFRHLSAHLDWADFVRDAEIVISGHSCAEREVATLQTERCFLQRICPYLTAQGEIDGIVVSFIDITERKRMEDALKESEQRVRLKLDSVLSPEGDLADLELGDIIDAPALQSLVDDFYALTRMPMGLLDLNGRILVGVGWQDLCTRFHRVNAETCRNCLESDLQLSAGVAHGQYKVYKCKNHMWDVATPIMVGETQFGNLFMGQFFFEDEPIDYALFRNQARRYGFDEKEYLAALERVPRLSRETLDISMAFFMKLADLLSKLSYSNLKLARSLAERDSTQQILRRYELLARHSRDIILFVERDSGRILEANDAAQAAYGYSHDELLALTVAQLRAPESQPLTEAQMALADSRGILFETMHRRKDGSVFPVEVSSQGASIGGSRTLISVIRDITGRRESEAQLRRAHEELEQRIRERTEELASTVDTLRDEIGERQRVEASLLRLNRLYTVRSETDHAIVRATDRDSLFRDFCRIAVEYGGFLLAWVGLLDEESGALNRVADYGATGYLDGIRISADLDPEGSGPTGRAIRQEGSYICNDFLSDPCTAPWHQEGRRYGIRASASVAVKEGGLVIGAFTLYAGDKDFFDQQHVALVAQLGADLSFAVDNLTRDARRQRTELALREETLGRLRALEALREKEKMLLQQNRLAAMGEMINNIAHQWRQPLNVLGLLIQQTQLFLEMDCESREAMEADLGKAMELIKHMSQTIDDFRNFFLPDKEKARFALKEVVSRTVALVQDGFRHQQIDIEVEHAADPVVLGFANEFCQVLLNILMNARDALAEKHPAQARVRICVGEEEGRAVVTITDNAGGIEEEHLGKIFDPYFTTKGPDKGTGVGLFMSKAIIENNMGGRLTARNTDEGAEFRIEV